MDPKRGDYYSLLGIERGASPEEIGRAYRRAARATHPDIHPGEPSAAERFTAITIAYETLVDPARRASYDRTASVAPRRIRVEPVSHPPRQPPVAPVRVGRRPGIRVEPLDPTAPAHGATHATSGEAEILELAASLSRLLRATWGLY